MWVYFRQIGIFFPYLLTKLMRYFRSIWAQGSFSSTKMKSYSVPPQLTQPKKNSCMHCMPMILLFVQSTVSSFNFVCCDYIENFFFSLLCLVVLFSCILRMACSLLRLNISFKSCTMLFSSLFDFQVNIYITVCFNLNLFPIVESSPLFFSLTL